MLGGGGEGLGQGVLRFHFLNSLKTLSNHKTPHIPKHFPSQQVTRRRNQSEGSCPSVKGSQLRSLKGGSGHRESCGQTCGPDRVLDLGTIYCCVTPLSMISLIYEIMKTIVHISWYCYEGYCRNKCKEVSIF